MTLVSESNQSGKRYSSIFLMGYIAVFFCALMIFIMGLVKMYSPDFGFHLRSAKWILDNGKFIYNDSFSYGSAGHKYYDMQWLYQLLMYSLYSKSEALLIVANAMLITVSFLLTCARFLQKTKTGRAGFQLAVFAFTALVFSQALSFEVRPYVLSCIFLNLVIFFLERYKSGNSKAVIFLPVLIVLWANSHSLAVLGLVTIAIYNAGNYLETQKLDKKLLLFSFLSLASYLINPYFLNGLLYPLSQFGTISGNSLFKSYLGELRSPFTTGEIKMLGTKYFTSPLLIIHLSALLSVFVIFKFAKRKQFTDALLLAAYLVLLYMAHRNYGIFIWVSLPLFGKYVVDLLTKRAEKKNIAINDLNKKSKKPASVISTGTTTFSNRGYKRLSLATIVLAVLISLASITDSYPILRHSPYRYGLETDKDQLPVEATGFLNSNGIKGKLLNHLDFGGYLMAHFNEKVFIDGRMEVFDEDFFQEYYESLTMPKAMKKLMAKYNPDIVIFPYLKATQWWNYFLINKNSSGYKAVYFDGLSVIYLKSASYPKIPELNHANILLAIDNSALQRMDAAIGKEEASRFGTLIKGFWQKQHFDIRDQNKAIFCFTNGFDTAALNYSVIGTEQSTVAMPSIFKNLSIYYTDKKVYDKAALCEQKAQ